MGETADSSGMAQPESMEPTQPKITEFNKTLNILPREVDDKILLENVRIQALPIVRKANNICSTTTAI
jgi:hypothetical protein